MFERELANCADSPAAIITRIGTDTKKEALSQVIPAELLSLHEQRRVHIHDMEFYDSTYNCLGVNPSDLMDTLEIRTFSGACRAFFRGIIELTNRQSGGIGIINFDEGMSLYVGNESDEELEKTFTNFWLT